MDHDVRIVNLDRFEKLGKHRARSSTFQDVLQNGTALQLTCLLSVPNFEPIAGLGNQEPEYIRFGGALAALPPEMLLLVIEHIQHDDDAVCFALTCRYMFKLLRTRTQEHFITNTAPWAGDRVIMVRRDANGWPPELSKQSRDAFDARVVSRQDGSIDPWVLMDNPLWAIDRNHAQYLYLHQHRFWSPSRLTATERQRLRRLLGVKGDTPCRPPENSVLRNLTRKEYVFAAGLMTFTENGYEFKHPPSLADALAILTYWGDGGGYRIIGYVQSWIGDRFDMASLDDVGEGWEDVTAPVSKRVWDTWCFGRRRIGSDPEELVD